MTQTPPLGKFVRELTIARVIDETADARSLVFTVPEGTDAAFDYSPGQFLTLRIPSDRTGSVARCYSLSSSPHADDELVVTVKRTRDGYGSNWLCDNAQPGMTMHVLPPSGVFVPKNLDRDLLLLAGGSGITPMLSILKSALAEGSGRITLLYANRDENSVIFAETLRGLQAAHPDRLVVVHWLESVQGLPRPTLLTSLFRAFAGHEAFICGPGPFMSSVTEALEAAGFPKSDVHLEVFTSLEGDPFAEVVIAEAPTAEGAAAGPAKAVVHLDGATHEVRWPRHAFLLDVLLAEGIEAPFSCRQGECSACACVLLRGEVEMSHNGILDEDEVADGYRLSCQLLPVDDEVEVTYNE